MIITRGFGIGTNVNPEPPRDQGPFFNPDLIEIMGQSNAAGAAIVLPGDLIGPIEGCIIYNPTWGWQQMVPNTNTRGTTGLSGTGAVDSTGAQYGIECRVMKMLYTLKGRTQYLIKYAVSNTPLAIDATHLDWSTTNKELYDRSNAHSANARQSLGDPRPPRVIIWIQGENDADNATFVAAYEANLTAYIAAKRTFYGYQIPFVIVRLGADQTTIGFLSQGQTAQNNVVASVAECYIVSTDSLTTYDGTHWDDASTETLAQRTWTVLTTNNLI